jgi:glycosyltransferase involved in cell wall biosynthesis
LSAGDLRQAAARLGLPGLVRPPAPAARERPAPGREWARPAGSSTALVARCTLDHLPYARVLVDSIERFHPEIEVHLVVVDLEPDERAPEVGRARLVSARELGIDKLDYLRLSLSPAQLCMAVKPAACRWVAGLGYPAILSFDADIEIFAPLDELLEALRGHSWVVTPHLLAPYPDAEKAWAHPTLFEIGSAGFLNSGLFAFAPNADSLAFLEKWEEIVLAPGAFLDHQAEQNAFNWLTSFAEGVFVLRDPAYNVAYWNLHDRSLRFTGLDGGEEERFTLNGSPLVAFHWSGLPPEDGWRLSVHDHRHSLYLLPSLAVLAGGYRRRLAEHGLAEARKRPYTYAAWPSGQQIDAPMRRVFQRGELHLWRDLDPFGEEGEEHYGRALLLPAPGTFLVPALLWEIYRDRPDVQLHFPEARIAPGRLIEWFCTEGAEQLGYGRLVDRFRPTLPRREAILHLAALVEASPDVYGDLEAPLGRDRQAFIARLAESGYVSEANGVRGLDPEIWAPSLLAAIRDLVGRRPDVRAAFPDHLGADAERLAEWLDGDAVKDHLLPPGCGRLFLSKANGHALGRVYSFYRRHRWLQDQYPLAFVGEKSETLATALLERWPADCEFDLDDVAFFLWEMAERPWLGVGATLEAPVHARRPPSFAGLRWRHSKTGATTGYLPALLRGADENRGAGGGNPLPLGSPPSPSAERGAGGRGPSSTGQGVNCFGYFKSPIGLGNLSRGMASALEVAGFGVARQLRGLMEMSPDLRLDDFVGTYRDDYATNLFVSFPHLHSRLLEDEPVARTFGRRNVVYLAWEQRDGHPWWREVFGGFDQIWALSSFAAGAISRATGREVLAVPAVLDFASLPPAASPAEAGLDPERCTFLYVFDANSSLERKNPAAAIEAFRRAFAPGDKVELLLKASHGGRLEHRRQLARLESQAAATGLPIRFETRHLSRPDLMRLVSASGAYLSLHRAEGFGYTCAEAMAYGVPVIATGYSGNLDFMDRDTAYLVDAREVEVEVPDGPFQRGSVWAEPDLDHAASLMRQVYENREAARELGARGAAYVREMLAIERIATIVGAALRGDPHP